MKLRDAFFRELPGEQQLFDLGTRTDGQPVYSGHAVLGAAKSAPVWILTFHKYDASDNMTEAYCLVGAWDNRVTLFLDYV